MGNQVNILSGLHLLSDITVTVQITVQDSDSKAAKLNKAERNRKSNKSENRKASDGKK